MNIGYIKRILSLFFLCGLFFTLLCNAQKPRTIKPKSPVILQICPVSSSEILDRLFPRIYPSGADFHLVIRYQSVSETQFQINIFSRYDETQVTMYELKDGNILQKVEESCRNTEVIDIAGFIREIKIEKRQIYLDSNEVMKIRDGFFEMVKKSIDYQKIMSATRRRNVTIIHDADSYSVWFDARGAGGTYLNEHGLEIDSKPLPEEHPLLEWVREIYRTVRKVKSE